MKAEKWKIPEGACDCHHHIVDIEHFLIDASMNSRNPECSCRRKPGIVL